MTIYRLFDAGLTKDVATSRYEGIIDQVETNSTLELLLELIDTNFDRIRNIIVHLLLDVGIHINKR